MKDYFQFCITFFAVTTTVWIFMAWCYDWDSKKAGGLAHVCFMFSLVSLLAIIGGLVYMGLGWIL